MATFFERQDEARKRTRLLVALFHGIVFLTAMLSALFYVFYMQMHQAWLHDESLWEKIYRRDTLSVFGIIYFMVWGVALIRRVPLKQGGAVIAKLAGGRELSWGTHDLMEKKVLNIVEEMGIASGMPLPRVFVLDEEVAINAFAAGLSTHDACVAVSRGALEKLSREELQGVIAHEFSHIFNGDMKLNLHLLGYLYGLTSIADAGRFIMRSSSRSRSRKNNAALLGLGIFLIGCLGYVFAYILRAAVSRDRERLADASAVQFTRNPTGIGGALRKIWRDSLAMTAPRAPEISHFYFHWPVSFMSFLATHPPLIERIRALGLESADLVHEESSLPLSSDTVVSKFAPHAPTPVTHAPEEVLKTFYYWMEASPRLGPIDGLTVEIREMSDEDRFRMIERAIVEMKGQSLEQRRNFLRLLKTLIEEDRSISAKELVFYRTLQLELTPTPYKAKIINDEDLWTAVEKIAAYLVRMLNPQKEEEGVGLVMAALKRKPKRARAQKMSELQEAFIHMGQARLLYRPLIFNAFKESLQMMSSDKTDVGLIIKLLGLILEVPKESKVKKSDFTR